MLVSFLGLLLIYVLGFAIILIAASYLAPRIARRFSARLSLQASMLILGLIIIVSGLAGIGLIAYILLTFLEVPFTMDLIMSIIAMVLLLNVITYAISPLIINLSYGARPSPELQQIVNEVSQKLGFSKPPRAVVVNTPPNAFAYGNILFGRYVAVSESLKEITRPEELRAIIGHELGHHKHRDNTIMLLMGLIPSVLYFLGVLMIRVGFITGYARAYYNRRREGGGGLLLVVVGFLAILLSFIVQVLILAFSRLREYYADSAGAFATSRRDMQRALARIHLYYNYNRAALDSISTSKLRALFIYAFTEAYANPFYRSIPVVRDVRNIDIDSVVEELKRARIDELSDIFSTHPAIPKRIRFLETIATTPFER